MARKYDWEFIDALRDQGRTWNEIAEGFLLLQTDAGGVSDEQVTAQQLRSANADRTRQPKRTAANRAVRESPAIAAAVEQEVKKGKPEPYAPPPAYLSGNEIVLTSRPDNTYVFGVAGDKHIGSKYHRDDVLRDLYARFARAGVDAVFDTGNWIDGEARFNKHDLIAHGLDGQLRLMVETHPKIEGVTTYAVWGDDHEGWYAQREGIDVGDYAAKRMREAGHLWVDLGFMEAHVILENANTGKRTRICVIHPGGGSAYATSYRPQKIVESMEGGEKPAAIFMGHYHKLETLNVRNVWTQQCGTTQDQTPFMRKKSIEAHVGGVIMTLEQDPESGALIGFGSQMSRYFNRGFYNNRWNHTGPVNRPARVVGS